MLQPYRESYNRGVAVGSTFIGLGSNLGDPEAQIERALSGLREHAVDVEEVSSLYRSEPVDTPTDHWFVNGVARVSSKYNPHQLLRICHLIESAQGRERTIRHGPRTIDLDLLLVGSLVLRGKKLILPHPELHRRRFVLVPLVEIAPEIIHPKLGLSMKDLLSQCRDTSAVVRAGALVPR